ncbi:MAG: succinate dehydrogenase, cytochrome b556 subunit [Hyphomicrobiaceae bacterium]|nr:succinate dehydrogenase, cytochrome b556 subunit [Hyphomicrobiaceae bacterium]
MHNGETSQVQNARPLSPHLYVYKPEINMLMSIVHRATGAALYFGTIALVIWLIATASSEEQYQAVNSMFATLPGRLIVLGYTWALLHHMFGGIRHLIWDVGYAFNLSQINYLCWFTLIASLTCTVGIWVIASGYEGVF